MKAVAILALTACASLPHVDSKPRDAVTAARAAVDISVSCGMTAFGAYTELRDPSRGRAC